MNIFKNLTLRQKKSIIGIIFISPFLFGFFMFFLAPIIQTVSFSVNELNISRLGLETNFVGLDHYNFAFSVHPEFIRTFFENLLYVLLDLPLILFFSFFAALMLNQKFKGRLIARAIFFLPVILASSAVIGMDSAQYATEILEQTSESVFLSGEFIQVFLMELQLPEDFIGYIIDGIERLPEVIRASGIQILIFLAGLQSVPDSYFEASRIEGATTWENFWLITFPLMTPVILINVIYTLIDLFLAQDNELVELIQDEAFVGAGYGVSSAMAVVYFIAVAFIILVVGGLLSRYVFYQE